MPQAPEELRKKWGGYDGIGEDKAIAFLKGRGFTRTNGFCWKRPSPGYDIQEDEWEAMNFLCMEWDWGGIIDDPQPERSTSAQEGK